MKIGISMTGNATRVVLELLPSIQAIFNMGFIPGENEIIELDQETIEAFEEQTGQEITGRLYSIQSVNPKYERTDKETGKKVLNVLRDDEIQKLRMGIDFFAKYARDNNISTKGSDFILKHAAKNLPSQITDDTPFEQPKLKLLNKKKAKKTDRDEMMEFLYSLMGKEDGISLEIRDEKGIVRKEAFSPSAAEAFEGDKMSFDEFKAYIIKRLSEIFTDEKYTVIEDIRATDDNTAYEVIRVQQEKLGITYGNGFRVSPFYYDYTMGESLDKIVEEMLELINDGKKLEDQFFDLEKIKNFEAIKDRVIVRPINYEANKELLKKHMYRVEGEIALVIYTTIKTDADSGVFMTAKILKENVEEWGMTEKEVFDWAIQNTLNKYKPFIVPMSEIDLDRKISDFPAKNKYFMDKGFKLKKSLNDVYLLQLEINPNASTAMFLEGVPKKLAEILDDDLYFVLTSTNFSVVHTKSKHKLKDVLTMIENDIERTHDDRENFLSEGVYYYDRKRDILEHFK
ncbi:MAG: DUF5688 family protein [Defluviitaleaceae bacterium]|nr:DUF5688 family protein [Defluviitaleaceae bacterium]